MAIMSQKTPYRVGPECPNCGCNDTVVTRFPPQPPFPMDDETAVFAPTGKALCRHCGCRFGIRPIEPQSESTLPPLDHQESPPLSEREEENSDIVRFEAPPENGDVWYSPIHCPECGLADVKTTRTMPVRDDQPRKRYHQCRGCGNRFSSVERG